MIEKVFQSYQTILEMLKDRNYLIDNLYDINYDIFEENYKNKNINIYCKKETNEKMFVYFYIEHENNGNFKKDNLTTLLKLVKEKYDYDESDKNYNIIIILKDKYPVLSLLKDNDKIELFVLNELIINKIKHDYVPTHILLSNDEVTKVLEKYKCSKEQLPLILKNDPIAKYYGAKEGDVFKIIRNNYSIGNPISYRITVSSTNFK